MLNSKTLSEMSQVDISRIDPSTLADIKIVAVNHELPHEERVLSFIEQIGNPYCFMSGDIPVRVRFIGKDKALIESLVRYFSRLKQN